MSRRLFRGFMDKLRVLILFIGLCVIGIPIARLVWNWYVYDGANRGTALLMTSLFVVAWLLLCGFCTRRAKMVYWATQAGLLFVICFVLNMARTVNTYQNDHYGNGVFYYDLAGSVFWLPIPIGLMLILLALYKPIIAWLSRLPFMKRQTETPVPQPATPPAHPVYQQGYQPAGVPAYEEGGKVYPYSAGVEHPQAQYVQEMTQQQ